VKNVKMKIDGNQLVITVDLLKRCGPSKSGKTVIVATSEGNATLPHPFEHIALGLNAYTNKGD
jgi:hypothetical protein